MGIRTFSVDISHDILFWKILSGKCSGIYFPLENPSRHSLDKLPGHSTDSPRKIPSRTFPTTIPQKVQMPSIDFLTKDTLTFGDILFDETFASSSWIFLSLKWWSAGAVYYVFSCHVAIIIVCLLSTAHSSTVLNQGEKVMYVSVQTELSHNCVSRIRQHSTTCVLLFLFQLNQPRQMRLCGPIVDMLIVSPSLA